MKVSLVAYDFRKLHKKSKQKIVKYGYVEACPKYPATQIWLLENLGVNNWRCITLLGLVYKGLAKPMTRRIESFLDCIVRPNQTGFLSDGSMSFLHLKLWIGWWKPHKLW
jgi:hypothetical protein